MAATAIVLVLLSAVLHVGWNLLVKSSSDPRAFMDESANHRASDPFGAAGDQSMMTGQPAM